MITSMYTQNPSLTLSSKGKGRESILKISPLLADRNNMIHTFIENVLLQKEGVDGFTPPQTIANNASWDGRTLEPASPSSMWLYEHMDNKNPNDALDSVDKLQFALMGEYDHRVYIRGYRVEINDGHGQSTFHVSSHEEDASVFRKTLEIEFESPKVVNRQHYSFRAPGDQSKITLAQARMWVAQGANFLNEARENHLTLPISVIERA